MYNYLNGRISEKGIDYIVVDCGGVGYHVFVSRSDDFKKDDYEKVYTYLSVREDDMTLYGFKTKEEKNLFLKIISVSGIGPKTAITMLSVTTPQSFIQAIELGNTGYLKKLPGIGAKSASQIILDLKGKLVVDVNDALEVKQVNKELEDTREALKGLGFKVSEIDAVLKTIGQ